MSATGRKRHDQERQTRLRRRAAAPQAVHVQGFSLDRPPEGQEQERPEQPASVPPPLGIGAVLPSIRDVLLERRSLRERWPVPEHLRKGLIDRQILIALSPETPTREAIWSFKAILAADALTLQEKKHEAERLLQEMLDFCDEVISKTSSGPDAYRRPCWRPSLNGTS